MSRIGRLPISIPPQVKVEVQAGQVKVEGPKGKLDFKMPSRTSASVADGKLVVTRDGDDAQAKSLHGLSRAILHNLVKGVSEGFAKRLEIHGVGFKAQVQGLQLTITLGYSHPVVFDIPPQIKITVEENTKILIEGPDKQLVGEIAAELRSFYPPEPYKGKGIRYTGEKITRKEGKTVQ
jgi:large subunit ribosomal protein L6